MRPLRSTGLAHKPSDALTVAAQEWSMVILIQFRCRCDRPQLRLTNTLRRWCSVVFGQWGRCHNDHIGRQ
jgi:hypothetical protein